MDCSLLSHLGRKAKMKVTVYFGKTAIVVPCKDGKISVRELIQQAAQRYIKAKEKVSKTFFSSLLFVTC